MTNPLAFAESLLLWHLPNYAVCTDPVRETGQSTESALKPIERTWLLCVAIRSLAAAMLVAWIDRFSHGGLLLAGTALAGSLALPLVRRTIAPAMLAEFELAANLTFAGIAWSVCTLSPGIPSRFPQQWSADRLSVICIAAAILAFIVRGGGLFVRGILEKAGGLTINDQRKPGDTAKHGEMIGNVERLIVVLIVMVGNLQALAFFFAAKGLIRSEELKERTVADYFLLGSLGSFPIALVCGLILQKTIDVLWR